MPFGSIRLESNQHWQVTGHERGPWPSAPATLQRLQLALQRLIERPELRRIKQKLQQGFAAA